jgi:threonine dehydrogenase-like Zn-dependent dehydrogenase
MGNCQLIDSRNDSGLPSGVFAERNVSLWPSIRDRREARPWLRYFFRPCSRWDNDVLAAYLPGNRVVELREVEKPEPGEGQVLLAMRASTICGSDLRAIYREHLGEGPEAYQDVVGGHEPSGQVVAVGSGVPELAVGDRVVVYHISGCGVCDECRKGYQISCTSESRRAYGWQRDGGHADYLLAEHRDLLKLPDNLDYLDGACVACGFGTAYEALCRVDVSGRDRLLVVGLGPVGLAVGLLAKAMGASEVIGTDPSPERRALAVRLGAIDTELESAPATHLGDGADVVSVRAS